MTLTYALIGAAIGVGAMHTSAPDHWVPFAALARAQQWSARRTATITAVCGLGHVTVSATLGLLALFSGRELFQMFGERLESLSGLLLIGFGLAYGLWGLRTAMAARIHDHAHAHGLPHLHAHSLAPTRPRDLTPLTLFLLFSADPCVAVIPLVFASAPLGWPGTVAVVLAYEIATIGTMVLLVLPARAAAAAVRGAWADRYGDALAGGVVAAVGLAVVGLGL